MRRRDFVFVFFVFAEVVGLLLLPLDRSIAAIDESCLRWFSRANIASGDKCEWKCAALPVDMGTFTCGSHCTELCKMATEGRAVSKQTIYTPYLTLEEVRLSAKYPKEALKVYELKRVAERFTNKNFGRNDSDDESDAFRHYVWAALLSNELGPEIAKQFLDAHESSEQHNDPSLLMDLANNRAGIIATEILKKKSQLTEAAIEKIALQELKDGKLIVLRKRGGPK